MRTKSRDVRSDERKQQLQRLHFVVLRNVFPRSEGNNALVNKVLNANVEHMRKLVFPRIRTAEKTEKLRMPAEERVFNNYKN